MVRRVMICRLVIGMKSVDIFFKDFRLWINFLKL
jgi:hypothetical protein